MHAHARTARTAPHTDMQALAAAEARQAKFAHNFNMKPDEIEDFRATAANIRARAAANKPDGEAESSSSGGFISAAAEAIKIVGAGVACAKATGVL